VEIDASSAQEILPASSELGNPKNILLSGDALL